MLECATNWDSLLLTTLRYASGLQDILVSPFGSNFTRNNKFNQFWFKIWFTIRVVYFKTPQFVERHHFGWSLVTGMNSFRKTAIIEFAFVCLYFLVRKEPFGIVCTWRMGCYPRRDSYYLLPNFAVFSPRRQRYLASLQC